MHTYCSQRARDNLDHQAQSLLCMHLTADSDDFCISVELQVNIYLAMWLLVKCLEMSVVLLPVGMPRSVICIAEDFCNDLKPQG